MRKIKGIVGIFLLLIIVTACSKGRESDQLPPEKLAKDSLVLALGPEPEDGFSPVNGWGKYGAPLFQSTLLTYDRQFNLTNDLAEGYTVSDDKLKWEVKIKTDAKFSDGKPLTVADVVFTFNQIKKEQSIVDLQNIEKIEEQNAKSVLFVLKTPDTTFAHTLATTGIFSEKHYSKDYSQKPIGSGPYMLVQWDHGEQLIVKENPYYYGKKPFFKQLTFLFLDEEAAIAATKKDQIDVLGISPQNAQIELPGKKLASFTSVDNRGLSLPMIPEEVIDGVDVGNNVTADRGIRRAMNIAINREEMVKGVIGNHGTPAYSVADKLPWWNEETVFEDNQLAEAKKILAAAGWKLNQKEELIKDGLIAEFDLLYPAGDSIREGLALTLQKQLRNLGITVTPKGQSWEQLEKEFSSSPTLMGWGSNTPLEMYNIYSKTTIGKGMYNINHYQNSQVETYMDQALAASNQEEANRFWKLAQWDGKQGFSSNEGDVPWLWLVNLDHLYVINENLELGEQKIQPHGHGWPITDFITEWKYQDDEKEK